MLALSRRPSSVVDLSQAGDDSGYAGNSPTSPPARSHSCGNLLSSAAFVAALEKDCLGAPKRRSSTATPHALRRCSVPLVSPCSTVRRCSSIVSTEDSLSVDSLNSSTSTLDRDVVKCEAAPWAIYEYMASVARQMDLDTAQDSKEDERQPVSFVPPPPPPPPSPPPFPLLTDGSITMDGLEEPRQLLARRFSISMSRDRGRAARRRARLFSVTLDEDPTVPVLCTVCLDDTDSKVGVHCSRGTACSHLACPACCVAYFSTRIRDNLITFPCMGTDCNNGFFAHGDVFRLLAASGEDSDGELRRLLEQHIAEASVDPSVTTCPSCKAPQHRTDEQLDVMRKTTGRNTSSSGGLCTNCTECAFRFCFTCSAPSHQGISCRAFGKGSRALRDWMKSNGAHFCPKCRTPVQRTSGCNHMTCRCGCNWCYACGDRRLNLGVLGKHTSKLSLAGCKHNFMPNAPVTRVTVRVSFNVVAAAVVVPAAATFATAIVLGAPFYYLGKYAKQKHRSARQLNASRRRRAAAGAAQPNPVPVFSEEHHIEYLP